ncbi:MAG: helix-turn-helix transcriptional regulator [Raoultibacter sp.]
MRAWCGFRQGIARREVVLALAVGMYWVWWDSFHEVGRFFMQVPLPFEFVLSRYSSVSCFFKPAGVVLGCVVICVLLRCSSGLLESKRLPFGLFVAEILLHVLYYLFALVEQYAISCLVYAAISACIVPSLLILALQMKHFSKREVIIAVMGSIGCYGLFNNLLFPCSLRTVALSVIGVIYLIVFVVAYFLSSSASKQSLAFFELNRESVVKTPLPLVVHLFVYGLAFGILHIIGGLVARGSYSINIAVFFACIVTIVCIAFLFLRKRSNHEIWSKIRSTVFPLSVIGYLLIPLVSNSDVALALTEAGNLLYNAIFVIGCFALMRKTYVDPRTIIAKGLFYKNVGTIVGVVWARGFCDSAFLEGTADSLLSVIIVFLLTIATFWVGSDERIRKIWGLRKNLSPKQYNDCVLRLKSNTLAKEHGLTARESEVLLLSGQGMRASEIKEMLGISIDTVRSHTKHLYVKLNVHSFEELQKVLKSVEIDDAELE